jgi:D-alanine-D-alanine ligase
MNRIKVGVMRGGPSSEYEVSLNTGASVLKHLPADKYLARDILIDKNGAWHLDGLPTDVATIANSVDVVFNALHGEFGEDGQVQKMLDQFSLPYTGSGHFASALGMNKTLAKAKFKAAGLRTPVGLEIRRGQDLKQQAQQIFYKISPPWIIKPVDKGSSVGLALARSVTELEKALEACLELAEIALVEEYIKGKEATCGVVEGLRGQAIYPLFPTEIRKPAEQLVDYQAKYSGETEEICPGLFTETEKRELERQAILAHQVLGLAHYSRSDFIITPRGIYILETNSLPGLTENSLLPKALKAGGVSYPDFLEHLLNLARA